jgi:hypothetical protein
LIRGVTIKTAAFPSEAIRLMGHQYEKCFFDNCSLSPSPRVRGRAVEPRKALAARAYFGQCTLIACSQRACGISGAILDEVTVDSFATVGRIPLFLDGVAFRHVVLAGRLAMFKINPAPTLEPTATERQVWIDGNRDYYAGVDWALDISRAQFVSAPDLHYVPGHLVRRDEETQALASRSILQDAPWQSLPWGKSALRIAVEWFLDHGPYDSVVIAAARKSKYFREDLAALKMLRSEGLAV